MTPAVEERERVGPYRVLKAIGAGGSARIDLARLDRPAAGGTGFARHVVIKRPLEHLRDSTAVAESLRREARLGGRLRHPNLVAVLDAGVHVGYDYVVLEYVHGASLRELMDAGEPGRVRDVPLATALAIGVDVARGMHAAHELTDAAGAPLGLVHRDVSPGNVLLGLDGTVKLADFGLAKETRVHTLSGSMHGTVTYMAPEQCRGHAFDRRADVWSLGVILYELCTGARLFWADNDVASLHRVLSGSVPRPREVKPSLAPVLEEILLTAIAAEQTARFATAAQLAEALETYAAAAGELLGARWIARTVSSVLGPRQVPWIGTATVPARAEEPLVALIEAAPAEDEDSDDISFGSKTRIDLPAGDAAGDEDAPTLAPDDDEPVLVHAPPPPRDPEPAAAPAPSAAATAPPPRRMRAKLGAVIVAGVLGGSAATAYVMLRAGDRAPHGAAIPSSPPTAATASGAASAAGAIAPPAAGPADPGAASAAAADPATTRGDAPADSPAATAPKAPARTASHRRPAPAKLAGSAVDAVTDGGSGSSAAPPHVEWTPGMLLPSDHRAAGAQRAKP